MVLWRAWGKMRFRRHRPWLVNPVVDPVLKLRNMAAVTRDERLVLFTVSDEQLVIHQRLFFKTRGVSKHSRRRRKDAHCSWSYWSHLFSGWKVCTTVVQRKEGWWAFGGWTVDRGRLLCCLSQSETMSKRTKGEKAKSRDSERGRRKDSDGVPAVSPPLESMTTIQENLAPRTSPTLNRPNPVTTTWNPLAGAPMFLANIHYPAADTRLLQRKATNKERCQIKKGTK
jgi:hypothetical protein